MITYTELTQNLKARLDHALKASIISKDCASISIISILACSALPEVYDQALEYVRTRK